MYQNDRNDSPPDTPSHSVSTVSAESEKGPLPRVATTVGTSTAFSSYSSHRDTHTDTTAHTSTPAATVAFVDSHAFPTDNSSTAGCRSRTSLMFIDSHAFPTDNSSTAGFRSRTSLMDSNPASMFPSRAHSLVPDVSADYHHFTFGASNRLSIASSGVLSPDAQSAPALYGFASQYGFLATPMINNSSQPNIGIGRASSMIGRGSAVSFAEEMTHIRSALITTFLAARSEGINREYSERYSTTPSDTHHQEQPPSTLSQQPNHGSSGDGYWTSSSEGAFGAAGSGGNISITSALGGSSKASVSRIRGGNRQRHHRAGLPMGVVPIHSFIDDDDDDNVNTHVADHMGADNDGGSSKKVLADDDGDEEDHVTDFSTFIPFMDPVDEENGEDPLNRNDDESSSAGTQAPPSSSTNTQHNQTNLNETTNSGTFEMSASDMFCPPGVMSSSMDTTGQHRTLDVLNIHSPLVNYPLGQGGGGSRDRAVGALLTDPSILKPWGLEANSTSGTTTGDIRSQSVSICNERFVDEQLMMPGVSGRTSSLSISITSRSVHGGAGCGGHLDPLSPSFSSGGRANGGAYSNFRAPFLGRRVIAKQLFIPVPSSYVSDLHQQQLSRSGSVSTNMSSSRASRTSWPFMNPAMRMRSRRSRVSLGNVPPAPKSIAHPSPPPVEFQDSLGNSWTRTEAIVGTGAYSTVYKGSQTHTPVRPANFSPHHVAILEESDSLKCAVAIKAVWLGYLTPAQVISVCNGEVMSMIVLSRGANTSNRSSRSSGALSSSNHHNHFQNSPAQPTSHMTATSSTAPDSSTTPHGGGVSEGSNGVTSPLEEGTTNATTGMMTAILPQGTDPTTQEQEGSDSHHPRSEVASGGGGANPNSSVSLNGGSGDHLMRSTTVGHDMRSPSFSIGTSFGTSMSIMTMGGSSGGGASSPYVLPLLGFSLAPETGYLLLVHPLLEGRSLSSLVSSSGQLPIPWIKILIADVLNALIVLHAAGITHRDVKPQNVFLRKGTPGRLEMLYGAANDPTTNTSPSTRGVRKLSVANPLGVEKEWDEPSHCMLGDLGSALVDFRHHRASTSTRHRSHSLATTTTTNGEVMSDGSVRDTPIGDGLPPHSPPSHPSGGGLDMAGDALQGTPPYMSPEACCGHATSASDVWSVGIMVFQMYAGRLPWRPTELAHPVLILQQHGKVDGFGPEWQDEFAGHADFTPTTATASDSPNQNHPSLPSDSVLSVLQCCLAVDPMHRWTATRLLAEHPFFINAPAIINNTDTNL